MGASISSILFQPILLGVAAALIIVGLIYQNKSSNCKSVGVSDNTPDNYGGEIFNIQVGLAIVIVIAAVIIQFISGFEI